MADQTGKPPAGKKGEEDLSMEDILQSIRRIIAEEDDAPAKAADVASPSPVTGSDILELSDFAEEAPAAASQMDLASQPIQEHVSKSSNDVLNMIDNALDDVDVAAEAPAAPADLDIAEPSPKLEEIIETPLVSEETAAAASAALERLRALESHEPQLNTTPSPVFRSGNTVEDMVVEFLRPMMKEWLDGNLPNIVERVVEHEVKRLTRH